MSSVAAGATQSLYVVVRTLAEVTHPHLNVWLPRGQLSVDRAGHLELQPNFQDTFEGLAAATTEIETRADGATAQVYELVSAELRSPPRQQRRRGTDPEAD